MLPKLMPIWVIAKNTYRELIRERLLYGVFLMAALVTAMSFFLSTVSLGQDARILHNLGLNTIHLFTVFIMVFVTTTTVARDLDKKTVYFLFPKPISRGQYVLGKYKGLLLLLLTTLTILGGLFWIGVVATGHGDLSGAVFTSLAFSFVELSVVIAIAQLFASFTAPLNAALYTLAFYIIGHSLSFVRDFLVQQNNTLALKLANFCYYFLPNLEKFDIRAATLYHIALSPTQVLWSLFYAIVYAGILLFLTTLAVRNREF